MEKNKTLSPLKFLLIFGGFMAGFYLLFATEFYYQNIYLPIVKLEAFLGSILLQLFAQGTYSEGLSFPILNFQ